DLDHSSKVLSMQEDDTEVVTASTPIPAAKPKILKIAAAPTVSTRRRKGVVIRDPEEELHTDTPAEAPTEEMDKEHEGYKNIDWNAALDHVQSKEPQYIKRYHGIKKKPQTESEARKNMISYLKNAEDEDDDMFVEATPLAQKVPVVDYQVVVIDNKPKYKIIRADDTHQFYISFITLLK
nr:hypothetical protein [Tanacetum cinerariifolium]